MCWALILMEPLTSLSICWLCFFSPKLPAFHRQHFLLAPIFRHFYFSNGIGWCFISPNMPRSTCFFFAYIAIIRTHTHTCSTFHLKSLVPTHTRNERIKNMKRCYASNVHGIEMDSIQLQYIYLYAYYVKNHCESASRNGGLGYERRLQKRL